MKPTIMFKAHDFYMPTASTCTNTLYLPLPTEARRGYPDDQEMMSRFDNAFMTKQLCKVQTTWFDFHRTKVDLCQNSQNKC